MNRKIHPCSRAAVATALALGLGVATVAAPVAAVAAERQPPRQQDDVAFVSGGVGAEAARDFKNQSRQWPLTLLFTVRDHASNAYLANVRVVVRDREGVTVLDTVSDGPFLLADLEPGRYTVAASFGGRTMHDTLMLKSGQNARRVFVWPAQYLDDES